MACMQQASYLVEGPLIWILPLYLHVNKKSDDDDDDNLSVTLIFFYLCQQKLSVHLLIFSINILSKYLKLAISIKQQLGKSIQGGHTFLAIKFPDFSLI